MPELPEVETIRRQLAGRIEGRVIEGATVSDARLVDPWETTDFADHLNGRRIERVDRVGKYLLLELDRGEALTLHLRMTGQLLWSDSVPDPPLPYTRAVLAFAGGGAVTFADARRFGTASFLPCEGRTAIWGGRTGVDAMSPSFTARALGRSLAVKKDVKKVTTAVKKDVAKAAPKKAAPKKAAPKTAAPKKAAPKKK